MWNPANRDWTASAVPQKQTLNAHLRQYLARRL
jgi:hypothetical protein